MKHYASSDFWECYSGLPKEVQSLADHTYEQLKADPYHPSLHFKKVGKYRSVRVGLRYRALAAEIENGLLWFWIGSHSDYDTLLGR